MKLSDAQQKFLESLKDTPNDNWAECVAREWRTAMALINRGLIELDRVYTEKPANDDRFFCRLSVKGKHHLEMPLTQEEQLSLAQGETTEACVVIGEREAQIMHLRDENEQLKTLLEDVLRYGRDNRAVLPGGGLFRCIEQALAGEGNK